MFSALEAIMGIIDGLNISPEMASRKLAVLAFIECYYRDHGIGPSYGEMACRLNTNTTRIKDAIRTLEREGRIRREPGIARSVRPLTAEEEAIRRLQRAGFLVTNPTLLGPPDLDHIDPDGEEEETDEGAH